MRFEGGDLYAFTTFGYTMTAGLILILEWLDDMTCAHDLHDFCCFS
jgi:hypothetical protein